MDIIRRFFRDEEGADLVEYALLVTLIATIVFVGIGFFSNSLSNWFSGMGSLMAKWQANL